MPLWLLLVVQLRCLQCPSGSCFLRLALFVFCMPLELLRHLYLQCPLAFRFVVQCPSGLETTQQKAGGHCKNDNARTRRAFQKTTKQEAEGQCRKRRSTRSKSPSGIAETDLLALRRFLHCPSGSCFVVFCNALRERSCVIVFAMPLGLLFRCF